MGSVQSSAGGAAPSVIQSNTAIVNTTGNTPSGTTQAIQPTAPIQRLGGSGGWAYHSPAWLTSGHDLNASLPQWRTNGHSNLGTFDAPQLPGFLTGGPLPQGYPWGGRTCSNTNYYDDVPNTGVTRHYDFTIEALTIAPDGVEKQGLVVNGQFPAPTIEANWGDWIEVAVTNNLDEGTSLHWHGLLQKQTPWFDGVPSVQQCPIAPGSTFTYRFQADLYGTTWYHSHYSAQYAGGIFGPLIIYGPRDNADYDEDLGPVLINDWFHQDYETLVDRVMAPASENLFPPLSNNVLINGKMNYPCENATGYVCTPNAGVSKFRFQSGKKYRLRLINAGAEAIQKFSIDGYKFTIIANDFVPIVPYETDVVTMGVGQRTDIVVEASGDPTDAVWMRSTVGPGFAVGGCSLNDGVSPTAVAAIYYENANMSAVPETVSTISTDVLTTCANDPLAETVPYYSITPTASPETVQQLDITYQSNGTHNLFFINNSTFRGDYNDPVLLDAKLGQTEFPAMRNVYDFQDSKSIRLVVYNHALTGSHPMHLHGHNMFVLAVGSGTWDGTVTNPKNPERRDVFILPVAVSDTVPSYIVIQIDADNPGVWPFHCHIAWHISGGLYINVLERASAIQQEMQIPSIMAQTCRDWAAWTGGHVVDEIDSGL